MKSALPLLALAALAAPAPDAIVVAAPRTHDDPRGLIPAAPPKVLPGQTPCGDVPARPLTLADLADVALCRNPQTAVAWAAVRVQAAQAGAARGALLPSVNAQIGPTFSRSDSFQNTGFVDPNGQLVFGSSTTQNVTTTARLAVSYLIFDGGGRRATIAAADAQARAALADYADTAQTLILNLVTQWNNVAANRAVEEANLAQVRFARESRDLAAGRARAGVATNADRLQAETSLAQAELTLIQTRASLATSLANLAVAAGLPPQTRLDLAPAPPLAQGDRLKQGADALIAEAERLRPDIVSARAQADAADANVRIQQSQGRPSFGLSASNTLTGLDTRVDRNLGSVGVSLSIPLFSGWNTRYNIAAARAQADQSKAQAEQVRQQAGLDVYSAYVALDAALAGLKTADVLVASATESANLAQGRYRAGTGTFADLLNAQGALANARQQRVQAEYNVRTADAQLARAVGGIGEAIDQAR